MPKMRWCFTRFRYAARHSGGPKCVGASLGSGMPPARHGWPKMRWCFTRFGVRAFARAYAARRVRDSLLSFLVLDQDIVAAHVRGVFLRADATRCGSHAVWWPFPRCIS